MVAVTLFSKRLPAVLRRFISNASESPASNDFAQIASSLILTVLVVSSSIHAAEPESLDRTLEPYLKEFGLPAIAAAVFRDGAVIACGVAGTRRAEQNIPVGIEDSFHRDRTARRLHPFSPANLWRKENCGGTQRWQKFFQS
jgi:hypothetical protein